MTDLSKEEQKNVRTAMKFLRTRVGSWETLAKALGFSRDTLPQVANGKAGVTASMAFRVARFANVSVDDLLDGMFPAPGTCPYCGHCETQDERVAKEVDAKIVTDKLAQ